MDHQASRMMTVGQKQELLQVLRSRVGGSYGPGFQGIPPRPVPTSPAHHLPLLSFIPSSRLPTPSLPTHSSVPSFANLNTQFKSSSRSPPLLPLPTVIRSRSLPCYSHRKTTKTINSQKRRTGLSFNTKEKRSPFPPPPPTPPVSKTEDKVEEKEEGEIIDNNEEEIFFFTSPPPSSLPLPRFTLRPRKSIACSNSSAASDDLRRLLRL
ncbi:hypothetical protein ZOSMA_1G02990 [Zostera marina]|uniref:Uncharacterized protein n=1 Tax=Zostera marina TaxID=29655 RepID=A0A0K9PMY5_ZOSMR|nr:hypothetical protein ZOSMA_1G02990 [Zostera marina]